MRKKYLYLQIIVEISNFYSTTMLIESSAMIWIFNVKL